jgi:Protein of unknown function (DUF2846)
MKHLFCICVVSGLLAGCVTSASGPRFDETMQPTVAPNQTRVYIYREKVFYLAQAPYIAAGEVAIDGRVVGRVPNGGYLALVVAPGQHRITAIAGNDRTTRPFGAVGGSSVYVQLLDKTRINKNAFVGGAVGATFDAVTDNSSAQDGRVWGLDFVVEDVAVGQLQTLQRAN